MNKQDTYDRLDYITVVVTRSGYVHVQTEAGTVKSWKIVEDAAELLSEVEL